MQDIVDIRPTERVNALRVISHDTDPPVSLAQPLDDQVLGEIGILVLVHQHVAEKVLILGQHVGMVAEKDVGLQEQVVEVHRPGLETTALVTGIDLADKGHTRLRIGLDQLLAPVISRAGDQGILRVRHPRLHRGGLIDLIVELHLLDDRLQQAF